MEDRQIETQETCKVAEEELNRLRGECKRLTIDLQTANVRGDTYKHYYEAASKEIIRLEELKKSQFDIGKWFVAAAILGAVGARSYGAEEFITYFQVVCCASAGGS